MECAIILAVWIMGSVILSCVVGGLGGLNKEGCGGFGGLEAWWPGDLGGLEAWRPGGL